MKTIDLHPYTGTETWLANPFTAADLKGRVWNIATDRVWLIAARGKGKYPRWPGDTAQLNVVLGFVQSVQVKPRTVETSVLRTWAALGGAGKVLKVVVDLNRLHKLLSLVSAPHVRIWDARSVTRQDPCLGIEVAPDFRMFLMGQVAAGDRINIFDESQFVSEPEPEPKTVPPPSSSPQDWGGFDLAMALDDEA